MTEFYKWLWYIVATNEEEGITIHEKTYMYDRLPGETVK